MKRRIVAFMAAVVLLLPISGCGISSADSDNTDTVYVTNSGTKYHRWGCQYLKDSCYSISLSEAVRDGYEPCSKCDP